MALDNFSVLVASLAALAHCYFAYLETAKWNSATVRRIAPAWNEGLDASSADAHVNWARRLAFNVGAYNLMLAAGLAWTAFAYASNQPVADWLSLFFAIWLIVAAAAALYTRVVTAFAIQGLFGLALLSTPMFR
jgi:uncharacterized membrane protein